MKMKKFLEHGIYFLALILPFQTRLIIRRGEVGGGFSEYQTIGLYVVDIFLIALLALFFFYFLSQIRRAQKDDLKIAGIWWIWAGLDLMAFISIWLSPDKILAAYKYVVFLAGIGLFFLVWRASFDKIKFVYFLLLGFVFQAVLGIIQFLNQYGFANKYLGLAEHNPKNLGVSVVETVGGDGLARRWLRAYGGLEHPNILGGILAIGIILVLVLFIRKNYFFGKRRNYWGEYLILFLLSAGLFFTFSRAAWLSLGMGIAVLSGAFIFKRKWVYLKILGKALGFLAVLVLVFGLSYKSLVFTRLTGETQLERKSNQERIDSLKEARGLIKENWFLGAGIGNYTRVLAEEKEGHPSWFYQPVHNTFLLVWSEVGIAGLFFYLLLFFYLVWRSLKRGNFLNLALLTSLLVLMMFDHWWWSLHFGILFWALIFGLIMRNNQAGVS